MTSICLVCGRPITSDTKPYRRAIGELHGACDQRRRPPSDPFEPIRGRVPWPASFRRGEHPATTMPPCPCGRWVANFDVNLADGELVLSVVHEDAVCELPLRGAGHAVFRALRPELLREA